MAAALLVGLYDNEEEEHHNRNVMAKRLPRPDNDLLHLYFNFILSPAKTFNFEFGGRITLLLYNYLFLFSVPIPAMTVVLVLDTTRHCRSAHQVKMCREVFTGSELVQ